MPLWRCGMPHAEIGPILPLAAPGVASTGSLVLAVCTPFVGVSSACIRVFIIGIPLYSTKIARSRIDLMRDVRFRLTLLTFLLTLFDAVPQGIVLRDIVEVLLPRFVVLLSGGRLGNIACTSRISFLQSSIPGRLVGLSHALFALFGNFFRSIESWKRCMIDGGHKFAKLSGFDTVDPAGEAVDPAFAIHNDKIPAVARRYNVALIFECGLEGFWPIAGPKCRRDFFLDQFALNSRPLFLPQFRPRRCAVGTFNSISFMMGALDTVVPEASLKVAGYLFVLSVIVAVADGLHAFEVDPRPNDMDVLATKLLVHYDDTRVTVVAKLRFKGIDCFGTLFGRKAMRRLGA